MLRLRTKQVDERTAIADILRKIRRRHGGEHRNIAENCRMNAFKRFFILKRGGTDDFGPDEKYEVRPLHSGA